MRTENEQARYEQEDHEPNEDVVRLKNGAILIAERESAHCRHREHTIVLAMWRVNNRVEYVTWAKDPEGYCFWGHYYQDDIVEAAKDYAERK